MTPNELATFLREEVPSLKVTSKLPLTHQLLSALDAAAGLLREAAEKIELAAGDSTSSMTPLRRRLLLEVLATLRLVVGEGERRSDG